MKSLPRKTQIRVAVLGLVILAVFWAVWTTNSNSLPQHKGKTIDQWFYGEAGNPAAPETIHEAWIAFKAVNSEAIPFLIETTKTPESQLDRWYSKVYRRIPNELATILPNPVSVSSIQRAGCWHLKSYGHASLLPYTDRISTLVPHIQNNALRKNFHSQVVRELVMLSESHEVKTNYFVTLLGDSDPKIKREAALALSDLDPSITNGIPILETIVTNQAPTQSLFSPHRSAIRQRTDVDKAKARSALARVAPELAKKYGIQE